MKDLTKIYIDLSKCTEEERKHIRTKIFNSEFPIATITRYILENMMEYRIKENPYLLINEFVHWKLNESIRDKTELTYPEFIKLFEGGEDTDTEKCEKCEGRTALISGTFYYHPDPEPYINGVQETSDVNEGECWVGAYKCDDCNHIQGLWNE